MIQYHSARGPLMPHEGKSLSRRRRRYCSVEVSSGEREKEGKREETDFDLIRQPNGH